MDAEPKLEAQLAVACASLAEIGDRARMEDRHGMLQQDELICVVVADGVGGQRGGAEAATIVVDTVLERFSQEALWGERALRSYLAAATARLAARKLEAPDLQGMSATVAAVLVDRHNRTALFGHLGDTRIYLFRRGHLAWVSKDHSVVQQFIDAGYCTPAQLRTHALRSTLFAAVGIESETPVQAIHAPVALEHGDALLLCSDGFWEWIDDSAMQSAFDGAASVGDWLRNMAAVAAAASMASGRPRDNTSAIALWISAVAGPGS